MSVTTKKPMLYCPQCRQTYEEGTQRFCLNDGLRLIPAPSSGKSANQTSGVFTNILNRAASGDTEPEDNFSGAPRFAEKEPNKTFQTGFRPPPKSKIFKAEPEIELELGDAPRVNIQAPVKKSVPPPPNVQKPLPRFITPGEIPAGQAKLGDRKTNPTGRDALDWKNPEVLLGQTIKGRYLIAEKIGEDETSIAYLAKDKIVAGKKVLVRISMDEDADDYFTDKNFAEERVSLSHVNHPNVASVIDSGELPEGKPFIINEYVEGKTLKDMLLQSGQFNVLRAARVVRQASYALSAVHQNGILHRSLNPENIVLAVSEQGIEQVKLTNFGVSKGNTGKGNLVYNAPEQLDGEAATFASDVYSLAVIAYQMLTNRLPFSYSTANGLLKSQREGLTLRPSNLRIDVPPVIDEILEKALAFNPSARYPKARDFGDAFFNAVTTAALWENDAEDEAEKSQANAVEDNRAQTLPPEVSLETFVLVEKPATVETLPPSAEFSAAHEQAVETVGRPKSGDDLLWERRSPEPPTTAKTNWAMTALLGAIVVLSVSGLWFFLKKYKPNEAEFVKPQQQQTQTAATPEQPAQIPSLQTPTPEEIESPPLARTIAPPPDTIYFENSKQNLKSNAAKNFLGFSLYYPKDWKQNDAKNNFLDISKDAPSGTPIEQMLVSYYDSKGTFKTDTPIFPSLVKETNETLKKIVPNYKVISEGETLVNGSWRAYEIKFEGAGETAQGETIKLWGKRFYIPAARNGMKNGYVLTMLATSLSPDVKSAADVGVKGELSTVLNTFEPNQNF